MSASREDGDGECSKTCERIDVHEELAQARVTRFHWQLGATMGALTFFDGYDTFAPAYVIHYVAAPWHLRPDQAGVLVSSGLIGFLLGAVFHGPVADRIGRRFTLLGGLSIMSIFTLATAVLATSFGSFCIARLLTGLGLGVLLPLTTTYINELTPRAIANTFATCAVGCGWALGGASAGVIGVLATPRYGWQSLFFIGALSLLLIPLLYFTLPESVKFLALKGKTAEIRRVLSRLRPEHAGRYRHASIALDAGATPETTGNPVATLLSAPYRRTTLAVWTAAFFGLFCIFGLSGWIPTVMIQRGETFGASFGFGALLQVASFVGGLACGYVSDRQGSSRISLIVWWGVGAAWVIVLAFFNDHAINVLCVAAAGFFTVGAQFVLNNFAAKAYGTSVRATAVGMELSVGRIGAILGPFVVGVLQEVVPGPTPMFVAIALASLIAATAIAVGTTSKPGTLGFPS